mmetsp:Transcript_11580/g.21222  ORF Transcript_11580/g.21222 Transcript_11580/m.21222 type:complete len:353 (+) Transcript_11580:150-1208(+)|eukprot:CAMPEP_0197525406 /NCGR_PEP_ID=MMETSP1318-20131121/11895_1 /TAXON_ID=552666 /ORGANISM="Partenskyella glossopodia, Strain RCC365" /LENGTH=352 /DNA_ID=CAMNT_0043078777 /DNA_START=82 /DNA_END=1140 /DNA_ORIENTATION=-
MGCGGSRPNIAAASKLEHISKCALLTESAGWGLLDGGIIAATALDARGSLKKKLEAAGERKFSDAEIETFKLVLCHYLGRESSAMLLDLVYAQKARDCIDNMDCCGMLVAYEAGSRKDGPPPLMPGWSAGRILREGGNGVKLLVYYNPEWDPEVKEATCAFVEQVGAECAGVGLPFFLEVLTLDEHSDGVEYARKKPLLVLAAVEEFSKPRYRVDVLKLEFPALAKYTKGLKWIKTPPHNGEYAYDTKEVAGYMKAMSDKARVPFIFLSAGVDMPVFCEMLTLAGKSGCRYCGVLCGRATWKGAVEVYAKEGEEALAKWVQTEGLENLKMLKTVLSNYATPLRRKSPLYAYS